MKASTHDGRFHADEIFALAVLKLKYPDIGIVRSRDEDVYKIADTIVDVGHAYDPENLIFDRHKRSFSLKRESGIAFASFGLVWKQYGESLCSSSESAKYIDPAIVQAIDADDNGLEFTARLLREWMKGIGVEKIFIEPGSPWENGYNESFNGKLSDEY